MRARRFADQIDVWKLPFEPLTRTISLTARKDILGEMPAQVAATLRPIFQEQLVTPAIARHPSWPIPDDCMIRCRRRAGPPVASCAASSRALTMKSNRCASGVRAGGNRRLSSAWHGCAAILARAGYELPVPEGTGVVGALAENLHLDATRGGGLGKDAGLVIREAYEVELNGVRGALFLGSFAGTCRKGEVFRRSAT